MKWKLILAALSLLIALAAGAVWYQRAMAVLQPGRVVNLNDIRWLMWVCALSAHVGIILLLHAAVEWAWPRVRRLARR